MHAHARAPEVQLDLYGRAQVRLSLVRVLSPDRAAALAKAAHAMGARWHEDLRAWLAPREKAPALANALSALAVAVHMAREAKSAMAIDRVRLTEVLSAPSSAEVAETALEKRLRQHADKLYPYQVEGIRWLASRVVALFCDEMGLGKTVQTLVALPSADRGQGAPATLVVCPPAARGVWLDEAHAWRPDLRASEIRGRGVFRWPNPGELLVMGYETLPRAIEIERSPAALTFVVGDEAHMLKRALAKRTKRFSTVAERARDGGGCTWLLTGSPLLDRLEDLWALTQALGATREVWGSHDAFASLTHEQVGDKFRTFALRRHRKDVLPDLPDKRYETHRIDLDEELKKAIDESLPADWQDALRDAIESSDGEGAGGALGSARRILAEAKAPAAADMAESFEDAGEPLVVFSCHSAPIDLLAGREGWAIIDGRTTARQRKAITAAFQAGELKGLAANIIAGGISITLTRAAHVLFVDESFTPGLNAQAADRVCRIGQTRGVVVHRLVARHPLDERLQEILDTKMALIAATTG